MKKKVYIAAQFGRQAEMREFREKLQELGYEVAAQWLDEANESGNCPNPQEASERDLVDVTYADLFILVNPPPYIGGRKELARGGRMYEAGYADAARVAIIAIEGFTISRRLVSIGNQDCIHLSQDIWEKFNTIEEFIDAERARQERHQGQG